MCLFFYCMVKYEQVICMSKVTYLMKRIGKMNFGNMFKTIDMVHEKNHKFKPFIFFDVVWCGLKYQAGYVDYYQFEMYKMIFPSEAQNQPY